MTAYEPQKRFGYRGAAGEDGSFLALEWLIEGRDGASRCCARSAAASSAAATGRPSTTPYARGGAFYMHSLGQYLAHFTGRTATSILAAHPQAGDREHLWTVLRAGLGLAGPVAQGDRVRLTPEGFAPMDGVVDYATPEFLGVRTSDGLYRFYPARGGVAVAEHHIFSALPTSRRGSPGSRHCSPDPPNQRRRAR